MIKKEVNLNNKIKLLNKIHKNLHTIQYNTIHIKYILMGTN